MTEEEKIVIVSYGRCVDCNLEVALNQNGSCSICQSNSVFKLGAKQELDRLIEESDLKKMNEDQKIEKDEAEK